MKDSEGATGWIITQLFRQAQGFRGDRGEGRLKIRRRGRQDIQSGGLGAVVNGTPWIVGDAFEERRAERCRGVSQTDGEDDNSAQSFAGGRIGGSVSYICSRTVGGVQGHGGGVVVVRAA